MKVLTTVQEIDGEGLVSLLGESVLLMCANYFYTGTLVGVNETCVKIDNPSIVYNTGEWSADSWADVQRMNVGTLYVQIAAIESFCNGR
jgi:hypothetical protein